MTRRAGKTASGGAMPRALPMAVAVAFASCPIAHSPGAPFPRCGSYVVIRAGLDCFVSSQPELDGGCGAQP
jgi:hypothetical protein